MAKEATHLVSWTAGGNTGNHSFHSVEEANDFVGRNKHTWKSHSVFELHPVKGADKGTVVPGVQEAKEVEKPKPMPTTDVKPIGQPAVAPKGPEKEEKK